MAYAIRHPAWVPDTPNPCQADAGRLQSAINSYQTTCGSTSRLQIDVEALYPTRYGALYWQDGEGGWLVPAPAGYRLVSLMSRSGSWAAILQKISPLSVMDLHYPMMVD